MTITGPIFGQPFVSTVRDLLSTRVARVTLVASDLVTAIKSVPGAVSAWVDFVPALGALVAILPTACYLKVSNPNNRVVEFTVRLFQGPDVENDDSVPAFEETTVQYSTWIKKLLLSESAIWSPNPMSDGPHYFVNTPVKILAVVGGVYITSMAPDPDNQGSDYAVGDTGSLDFVSDEAYSASAPQYTVTQVGDNGEVLAMTVTGLDALDGIGADGIGELVPTYPGGAQSGAGSGMIGTIDDWDVPHADEITVDIAFEYMVMPISSTHTVAPM